MLQIIDVNTNASNLDEVEKLKSEFKDILSPTVSDATLIIISNFPAIGSTAGALEYLVLFMINKKINKNYLKQVVSNNNYYVDSFAFLLKKIGDNDITDVDEQYFLSGDTAFDYMASLKQFNKEYENFFLKYEHTTCYSVYHLNTMHPTKYSNSRLFLNEKITAQNILKKIVSQHIEKKTPSSRINSFTKPKMDLYNEDLLAELAKDFVQESEIATKYGIITKRKLDRISTQTKLVDDIYDNVGKSLTVIKGKAGTGKTLALSRIIHKHVSEKHNVRFLTFNNLLVFDIKQNLRNFNYYGDTKIAVSTVHHFFKKLSEKLGITLILSEDRVEQLIAICDKRIEKFRSVFLLIQESQGNDLSESWLLNEIGKTEKNKADYDEYREFAKHICYLKDFTSFDKTKGEYLLRKKNILRPKFGHKVFIEDYYKVLELILLAVSDGQKFYDEMGIKNRYDLLAELYKIDRVKDSESSSKEIAYDDFSDQVGFLKRTTNWSRLLIIDEGQDFHVFEKEILYKLRGSENIIVAMGGNEQLVRHSSVLDWSSSLGKKVPCIIQSLSGGSFRQKQNIVEFVNKFGESHGFDIGLKSVSESKGVGKIIIDTRPKQSILPDDMISELKGNGEINGCSSYESILLLIPSKDYTSKKEATSFDVNEKDYFRAVTTTSSRHTLNMDSLTQRGLLGWDGVSESKGQLRIPYQNETRIIHYESCRGLEAWSCACIGLDEFYDYKRGTDVAGDYLADDLFLSEDERRSKYSANWCLMAFTRPIDTLYIHLKDSKSIFSQKLLAIARSCQGTVIYD